VGSRHETMGGLEDCEGRVLGGWSIWRVEYWEGWSIGGVEYCERWSIGGVEYWEGWSIGGVEYWEGRVSFPMQCSNPLNDLPFQYSTDTSFTNIT